jgi:hypothetical protein
MRGRIGEMSAPRQLPRGFVIKNMVRVEIEIRRAEWLKDPNLRWKAGLEGAGVQFRQRLQRQNYPPPPPMSWYVRTGLLADKAGFNVVEEGGNLVMYFGSTFYLPHLLYVTPNWSDKYPELVQYMSEGFFQGIKDYHE